MPRNGRVLHDGDINRVIAGLRRSGIRQFSDIVNLKRKVHRYIRFGLGQPEEPGDRRILRALSDAALSGQTQYSPNVGIPPLLERLTAKLSRVNKVHVGTESIIVTVGATFGLALSVGSVVNAGDEVLVPDPGYPNYWPLVRHYGGKPVFYPLSMSESFHPDPSRLRRLITRRTKAIILNSPGNPTGVAIPPAILREITRLAESRGIWVISDEVYDNFCYSGEPWSPLRSDYPRVIGIYSFSKSHGVPGLRVGYVVNKDRAFVEKMVNMQEMYVSGAPSVSQCAAVVALDLGDAPLRRLRALYASKMALALRELDGIVGYRPDSTYYILLDVSRAGMDSAAFAERSFRELGVLVAPGQTFGPGSGRYVRIALVSGMTSIREGIGRLKVLFRKGRKAGAAT